MTRADAQEAYWKHSARASDAARQLAFAGFGIIWVFKSGKELPQVPAALYAPAIKFGLALAADLLQYAYASAAWAIFHRYKERRVREEEEFRAPVALNAPTVIFFWAKLIVLGGGYWELLAWLLQRS